MPKKILMCFVMLSAKNVWGVCLIAKWCLTLCNPMDCSLPGSSVHGISQAFLGVSCQFLLQGIFPTQGSNPCLPHCRQILYHLTTREALHPAAVLQAKAC